MCICFCFLQLTVRHSFSTKYVCTLNQRLTVAHGSVIGRTQFSWFLELSKKVIFNNKILKGLLLKWIDLSNGFVIGDKVVNLIESEFCLGLGLSSEGKSIKLEDTVVTNVLNAKNFIYKTFKNWVKSN